MVFHWCLAQLGRIMLSCSRRELCHWRLARELAFFSWFSQCFPSSRAVGILSNNSFPRGLELPVQFFVPGRCAEQGWRPVLLFPTSCTRQAHRERQCGVSSSTEVVEGRSSSGSTAAACTLPARQPLNCFSWPRMRNNRVRLHLAAIGTSQRPVCSRGPPRNTHKKKRKQGGRVGFRLPTHRIAAAGALKFYCWHHRPHCAGAQSNHLSILRPDRQLVSGSPFTISRRRQANRRCSVTPLKRLYGTAAQTAPTQEPCMTQEGSLRQVHWARFNGVPPSQSELQLWSRSLRQQKEHSTPV